MAGAPPVEMLSQLEAARKLALADPQVYNQVVPGILPIIGPASALDVRRWGADFLAECFASPSVSNIQKEQLSTEVLPVLKSFLDNPGEDTAVVRSVVQASTSIYPLIFRRVYVKFIKQASKDTCDLTCVSTQCRATRPGQTMARPHRDQIEYPTTNGRCPDLNSNMLHKVCSKGGACRDSWVDSRSKSKSLKYLLATPQANTE